MLTSQLITKLSEETKLPEEDVEKFLYAFSKVLGQVLSQGEAITIRNLGTFKMKDAKDDSGDKQLMFTSLL